MLANGPRGSAPELSLARALQRAGVRYRTHVRQRIGEAYVTIDVVACATRLAIFIDGCFWHACPKHATWPKQHGRWWREKLAKNVARDRRQRRALRRAGWRVLRVWAHEPAERAAGRIVRAVRSTP